MYGQENQNVLKPTKHFFPKTTKPTAYSRVHLTKSSYHIYLIYDTLLLIPEKLRFHHKYSKRGNRCKM